MNTETETVTPEVTKKAKTQVVVNVSDESKAKINELKKQYNVSDKEFVAAVLVVLEGLDTEVVKTAVYNVTVAKQKAKIEAKIAKIKAELELAKAELPAE